MGINAPLIMPASHAPSAQSADSPRTPFKTATITTAETETTTTLTRTTKGHFRSALMDRKPSA